MHVCKGYSKSILCAYGSYRTYSYIHRNELLTAYDQNVVHAVPFGSTHLKKTSYNAFQPIRMHKVLAIMACSELIATP